MSEEENDIRKIFDGLSVDEVEKLITKVVQAYGKTLESCAKAGGGVYDESLLPYDKQVIQLCILMTLKGGEHPPEMIGVLKAGYMETASFQPGVGVGDRALPSAEELQSGSNSILDLAEKMKDILENYDTSEFQDKIAEEKEHLRSVLKSVGISS